MLFHAVKAPQQLPVIHAHMYTRTHAITHMNVHTNIHRHAHVCRHALKNRFAPSLSEYVPTGHLMQSAGLVLPVAAL